MTCDRSAEQLCCFPGGGGNFAGAGKQLPHGVVGIDWPENDKSPARGCLAKKLERRINPLLLDPSRRLHNHQPAADNRLAETLERARESVVLARTRGLIEDNIIESEAGAVVGQAFQKRDVQGTVPDVINRLVQLLG